MMVAARTRYALKILVNLAGFTPHKSGKLADIARRQAIPRQFLHQILLGLKSGGLVRSTRGPHGGYALVVPSSAIGVGKVVRVTQGGLLDYAI